MTQNKYPQMIQKAFSFVLLILVLSSFESGASQHQLSDFFSEPLLKSISATTQAILIEHDFTLQSSDQVLQVKTRDQNHTVTIDKSSRLGNQGGVYLGQIIETKEFVACKFYEKLNEAENQGFLCTKVLRRLCGVVDYGNGSYLIQTLVNGCIFSSNDFSIEMAKLDCHQKASVAISFFEELKLCYENNIFQCDQGRHNTMFDFNSRKVVLVDWDGVLPSLNKEKLDIHTLAVNIQDQGRIYDIFDVTTPGVRNKSPQTIERTGPYLSFLRSLLDCQLSMTEGPRFLVKFAELKQLIQQHAVAADQPDK